MRADDSTPKSSERIPMSVEVKKEPQKNFHPAESLEFATGLVKIYRCCQARTDN